MDLMRWLGPNGVRAVVDHLGRAGGIAATEPAADAADAARPSPTPMHGPYDRAVDALNRLPRPLLALGSVGLFGFAMLDPDGFAARMQGLAAMPEPLWWLVGGIVSFHFGARETHYRRAVAAEAGKAAPPPAKGGPPVAKGPEPTAT